MISIDLSVYLLKLVNNCLNLPNERTIETCQFFLKILKKIPKELTVVSKIQYISKGLRVVSMIQYISKGLRVVSMIQYISKGLRVVSMIQYISKGLSAA